MVAQNYCQMSREDGLPVMIILEEDWLKERRQHSWMKAVIAKLLAK